jgi:putative hydrolase of the HAD superfamily
MNYLEGISAIVFDLGGVIVDIDIEKTRQAFSQLLGQPELHFSPVHLPVFTDYEVGRISSDEFLDTLHKQSVNGTSRQDIVHAWNGMLLTIPERRIKMIEGLQKDYRLFILSNTNSIHVEQFEKMAPGYKTLSELFEQVYYSHLIGSRKPNMKAFEAVVQGSNLNPSTTLFVDDLIANIETAQQMGFKTLHIIPGMDVADYL